MAKLKLFAGMRAIKLIIALLIAFVLLLLTLCLILSSSAVDKNNLNDTYAQKIHQKLANGESFLLGDIFEFEFDEAYAIPERYSTGDFLLKKYNLTSSVEIKDVIYSETNRILFLKDRCVVFDYYYSLLSEYKIFTPQDDLIIFADTKITPLNDNQESESERFLFEGHIINGILDREYNERISEIIAVDGKDFILKDIFNFEFDKVYVALENEESYKNLHEKIDLKTSVYMKHDFDSNLYDRILFIKDGFVVFDYLCRSNTVFNEYKGSFVLPDEVISLN